MTLDAEPERRKAAIKNLLLAFGTEHRIGWENGRRGLLDALEAEIFEMRKAQTNIDAVWRNDVLAIIAKHREEA